MSEVRVSKDKRNFVLEVDGLLLHARNREEARALLDALDDATLIDPENLLDNQKVATPLAVITPDMPDVDETAEVAEVVSDPILRHLCSTEASMLKIGYNRAVFQAARANQITQHYGYTIRSYMQDKSYIWHILTHPKDRPVGKVRQRDVHLSEGMVRLVYVVHPVPVEVPTEEG